MTKFEEFEMSFNKTYSDIYNFMNGYAKKENIPLNFLEKENKDDIKHDSYGSGEHNYDGAIREVFPKEVTVIQYN